MFFYADDKGEKKLSKSFKTTNHRAVSLTFSFPTVQVSQKPTVDQEMMPGKFDFYGNFPFMTQFETRKKTVNLAHI